MRILAVLAALAIGGCAHQEATQKTTTKTIVKREKVVERVVVYVDKCPRPEKLGLYCKGKTTQDACDAEQRCQWVRRESKPHCRRLYCKPPYAN
jgi:hypothetical protein